MTENKLDYKKAYPDLYLPKTLPTLINVPAICYITIDGQGDPNQKEGEYPKAVELLYALTFTIKMSKMKGRQPEGYFDYVVPPLEGLWWLANDLPPDFINKNDFYWTSMIRQPEFVDQDVFRWATEEAMMKKPHLDYAKARLETFTEGLCVQMMHIGAYDNEPHTIGKMEVFTKENGYQCAIGERLPDGMIRRHHEIYLGDPRKTEPAKLKTIIRHPVRKIE